jgi:hypothetical protein
MAKEDAYRFCNIVASPGFATKHSELLNPIAEAVEKHDPNAVANIAASKLGLHFTGDELKQAGGEVAQGAAGIVAATKTVGFFSSGDYPFGPGGARLGIPGVTPPGMDIALKIALQTIARQMRADGKSEEEIRMALMAIAGGSSVIDDAMQDKSITGSDVIDDILKSTASVAAGTAQGIADISKKIADTIFSGW